MPHSTSGAPDLRERARETLEYARLTRAHRKIVANLERSAPPTDIRKVLIAPADVRDPVGSRGDDAMMTAVIDRLGETLPGATVHVATLANAVSAVPRASTVPLWDIPWRLEDVWQRVQTYDALVVIGADVMDGYYSSVTSMRLWLLADLMARARGAHRSKIVGFSFNEHPRWPVVRVVSRSVGEELVLNLRDERSRRRLETATGRRASLVADAAFMLEPRPIDELPVAPWLAERRRAGRTICALNIHPMLSPDRDADALGRLAGSAGAAVRSMVEEQGTSWVLVPHDHRDVHGDVDLLREVARRADRPDDVHVVSTPLTAAEIKALAGEVDAVITGRMHLAVAALGSGVPTAGITYQGKFDGLFVDHFGLPPELLLAASRAEEPEELLRLARTLVGGRHELARTVSEASPNVRILAERNLEGLTQSADGAA